MSTGDESAAITRIRREPPPFRRLEVRRIEDLTPHMRRVVLGGPELDGFELDLPAASVRLLLPQRGSDAIEMPVWTGNQFELANGERAPIRTFTPRRLDVQRLELTLDVVLHATGAATDWARSTQPGDVVAVSGPGRGYEIDTDASSYLLAGDESAIPAIDQLLEAMPPSMPITAHVEITDPSARMELHAHPLTSVTWHVLGDGHEPGDAVASAIEALDELPDAIWVAGEAAAVQRLRKHFFDTCGRSRSTVTARGYWKHGRSAT
ncbi:MAG: siderophore-interacting protein [Ilumatobacter sp.]|nr:siderophore-interacting protein [Ilumatobacter sp.]